MPSQRSEIHAAKVSEYFRASTKSVLSGPLSLPLDSHGQPVPFMIFGDFNFRLDACRLVEVNGEVLYGRLMLFFFRS